MKITHLPFEGEFIVTSPYGSRSNPFNGREEFHHGIDLVGKTSTDVYSTCEGVVGFAGYDPSGFGNYVKVVDSTGTAHYFAHLAVISVRNLQKVTYTTKLGVMGSSGNSTAPHTHYEIRQNGVAVNPTPYMRIPNVKGTYYSTNYLIDLTPPVPPAPVKPKYSVGTYKVNSTVGVNIRTGAGTNFRIKKLHELSADAQRKGGYVMGTVFNVLEVKDNWGRTPSGWVCLDYCVKV